MERIWIPSVEKKGYNSIKEVQIRSELLGNRKVFLTGNIDSDLADDFLQQMMFLAQESKEPVDVYINSPGGEIDAGLLIYDVLQGIEIPVNLICTGTAASMAAIILAAGEKGRRFILPHSRTMIHEPLLRGGVGGSATSIRNLSESILETRDLVNNLLAKHTGKTLAEINEATSYDNHMNAEESVTFGLCDRIVRSPFNVKSVV
ncbi:MAG: ATP-dependent Clp protease proteolytic subunit [Lachnospiraceae bacterium]|nr:ATP-dependent Clp protease proteolytic subunit [Lachnospiraceae bacterium]